MAQGHGHGGHGGHGGNNTSSATPGSAGGVPNPAIPPFMSADDWDAYIQALQAFQNKINDTDYELQKQQIDTEEQKAGIDRSVVVDKNNTDYNTAGRGLAQSSIRDAELWDIDATAALRKSYLDRQLNASVLNAQRQKSAAQTAWEQFQGNLNRHMVENAQAASEGAPAYLVEPSKPSHFGQPGLQQHPGTSGHGNGGGNGPGHGGLNTQVYGG